MKLFINNLKQFDSYGGITFDVLSDEFLRENNFEIKDLLKVKILDKEYIVPIVPTFNFLDLRSNGFCLRNFGCPKVILLNTTKPLVVITGLCYGLENENGKMEYFLKDEYSFPITIEVSLYKKQGYAEDYEVHNIVRTNNREDYPLLTDEEFANFRVVETNGIRRNILFRSSSPINPTLNRNQIVDNLLDEKGINTIANLNDSVLDEINYPGFNESHYINKEIMCFGLCVDFQSVRFRKQVKLVMNYIIDNKGPYLIHCHEGKDRTGFIICIIEMLMGASFAEVCDDYMKTFYNFFKVGQEDKLYPHILKRFLDELSACVKVDNIENKDLCKVAYDYLIDIGLSDDQITSLKTKLS